MQIVGLWRVYTLHYKSQEYAKSYGGYIIHRYIIRVKYMLNHILRNLAWIVGCKLNHKTKILSSSWVVDIKKRFQNEVWKIS